MNKVLFSKKSDEWYTPLDLFDELNESLHFTLDPCACKELHLCPLNFEIDDDGLSQSWLGHRVFLNPPYSNISAWVDKMLTESCTGVMLLPSRTDTSWFHRILDSKKCDIIFLKGRLRFRNSKNNAPFPSILVFKYII